MDPQFIYTFNIIQVLISSILALIFCVLALFVLVYYIRRRYKLHKEINRIPQELLIMESYRNHLKNLKIKCIINNFIIVILIMEFLENLDRIFIDFPYLIKKLVNEHEYNFRSLSKFQYYSSLLYIPMCYSIVPVLSMMMDFLWLAYRKYEYKYSIIRWTWYIVIRALVILLFQYSTNIIYIFIGYQEIYGDILSALFGTFAIIDFIQFVYYARKFYLHLKSREKEIRLFYFDKKAYLDSKYLRIHFKIATILVGIALFFFALCNSDGFVNILYHIAYYMPIPQHWIHIILTVYDIYLIFIVLFAFLISQVLFIFNYLYIFIVVVYKSYRDGQKLKNINNYIRPIVEEYHETCYNHYTNYS